MFEDALLSTGRGPSASTSGGYRRPVMKGILDIESAAISEQVISIYPRSDSFATLPPGRPPVSSSRPWRMAYLPERLIRLLSAVSKTLRMRWFWYSIASSLCWTGWAFTAKLGSKEIPPATMQFVSAFGFLLVGIVLFVVKKFQLSSSWRGGRYALLSGLFLGLGGIALYGAYRASGNGSVVTAVTSLYPVVTVLFAVTFLREKLNKLQVLGIFFAAGAILLLSS
ncbi:MAG: hypothetical protein DMG70_05705 [Acidobacteria bacterium]|nr:MAG: hypothetical protein DMG70_05705 [Acidobacteriota bacterium]